MLAACGLEEGSEAARAGLGTEPLRARDSVLSLVRFGAQPPPPPALEVTPCAGRNVRRAWMGGWAINAVRSLQRREGLSHVGGF